MKKFAAAMLAGVAMSFSLAAVAEAKDKDDRRVLVELPGRALEDRRGRDQGGDRGCRRQVHLRRRAAIAAKQLTDVESLISQGANALIILAQDASAIGPAVAEGR